MSGAAGLSAAKNRRSKTDPNQKQLPPPISCGKNGSCPPQKSSQNLNNNKSAIIPAKTTDLVDPNSLKILGPLPPVEILKLHEQRLNRFDERLANLSTQCSTVSSEPIEQLSAIDDSELDDCFTRLENLESKVGMLEEVIMTLQNKLTIAQNFAMETNLAMMKMKREQEEREEKATTSQDISKLEVEQLSDTDTDTNIDVSALPSSVDLTDIVDTIHNDEIVVSNITFTLNAGC